MTTERDKFLTEAMGECWHYHEDKPSSFSRECRKCGKTFYGGGSQDFSTWESFGKLWTWAIDQEWWLEFLIYMRTGEHPTQVCIHPDTALLYPCLIHPDKFATAVYEYLKSQIGERP